ncbi:hypothetical protein [Dokdonia sp.]|uniref:sacsin N-terminal ATP-binding-like domain-containing protein n=1 Tax=Dokdonia sp. TaxID=2024995 RepID=UPI003263B2A7
MSTNTQDIKQLDEASVEREKQRTESEARDIIHDVDRLYTFPEDKKTRWIWELLQNAKDVANPEGIVISITLTQDKLKFSHNGKPFETKHLLAILYKTSTKSLNGEDGTTGKYGTGFVTTHILNKKLSIDGVHANANGKRRFFLQIDRSAATLDESISLDAMQKSLRHTFSEIQVIGKKLAENVLDHSNTFVYNLTSDSYKYAEKGLIELRNNAIFTLLINRSIKKIEVSTPEWSESFSLHTEVSGIPDFQFATTDSENGLLFHQSEKLIFGIPAKKNSNTYSLVPLDNQAVLYKEFPLIGTEKFNLPILLQHRDFHPTELRDGIRTKITNKNEPDPSANKNRTALVDFISLYLKFIDQLLPKIQNAHLLAKSGLPEHIDRYSNIEWFEENIQTPIRQLLLSKPIVKTISGSQIKIENARFILSDSESKDDLFDIASTVIPEYLPEKESIWHWSEIIEQELQRWPANIDFNINHLVTLVETNIDLSDDISFEWLKSLYEFLNQNKLSHLGDSTPIYPTEANYFKSKDSELYLHPKIDNEFKYVSKGLGKDLNEEFLNRKVGNVEGIKPFDLNNFHNDLNKNLISDLKIEDASDEQIKAVFHVCCLFKSDRAFKRELWFNTINQLLPEFASEKKIISTEYENYYRSADLWSVKYVSYLIEKSEKPSSFSETYFEGHSDSFFEWYNQFLTYVFGMQEDSKEVILKKNIIPVQSDEFKSYNDFIYAEADSQYFDDTIKDIFKNYTPHGDPRSNIVANQISNVEIRSKGIEIITNEIDKLFYPDDIDTKVKPGKEYNSLFLSLSAWVDQFPALPETCLTKFEDKRPHLNMLALGEKFSQQINGIIKSGKSIDDIEDLAKINLTTEEMKKFESAAKELGTDQLLAKAQEMLDAKHQVERWKTIGKAAEIVFEEAVAGLDADFRIENPDRGKDFELILNAKGYSIEIKSVAKGKENVRMSTLQGRTASNNPDNYALCVMTRPEDGQVVDKNYFINESQFVVDIGHKLSAKIQNWDEGLQKLIIDDDVMVYLDDKTESVYVRREIWRNGISFNEFVEVLNKHFEN